MTKLHTDEDVAVQRQIGADIAWAWGVNVRHHNDPFAPIDCYAERNKRVLAFIEIKGRTHDREKYKTVYLSVRKWGNLHLYGRKLKALPLFAARFNDGAIGWVDVRGTGGDVKWLGRYDRGLNNDLEPMLEVPVRLFRIVGDSPSPLA